MQSQQEQKTVQKKLRLFEAEILSQGQPRARGEVKQPAVTFQDINVARMIEIDLNFMIFGSETLPEGQTYSFLYQTKGEQGQIQQKFSLHHQTLYIDKAVDNSIDLKKIVTFGTDCQFDEAYQVTDQAYVLKIWNYVSLIAQGYKYDGLTGGTFFSAEHRAMVEKNLPAGNDDNLPYQIPILVNGKPYLENVAAVRFTKDASFAAVVFALKDGTSEVMLYRLYDKTGRNLIPDKSARKPQRTFKVEQSKKMGNVIDLFLFKQQTTSEDYQVNMYLLLERGIIYYPAIEKHVNPQIKMEDQSSTQQGFYLKAGCADFNYITNTLAVAACQKDQSKETHLIRLFTLAEKAPVDHVKENEKKCIRYFRNHIVSVDFKPRRPGAQEADEEAPSQLQIYDLQNGITSYWTTSHTKILQVEIEEDAIYYLAVNPNNQVVLCKLYEMEDNVKIHSLLKKGLFVDAKNIANEAKFPPDIIAEISKDHADQLHKMKKYDEAVLQYIETIGHLNPSYVIQKFIQVPQLENLITYLEKLTQTPEKQQAQLSSIADYNKDYTALLLNCYVKKEKFDKIKIYINESTAESTKNKRIFDVATAIDVCREHKATREQAIQLATQQKEWALLVQIYIDDMPDDNQGRSKFNDALKIIEEDIKNIREKIEILKIYGPKILKSKNDKSKSHLGTSESANPNVKLRQERLMNHVQVVTSQIIRIACGEKVAPEFTYRSDQQPIKIEEILQIFVDHPDQLCTFLQTLIDNHGEKVDFIQRKLTDINLYHRLLECYLYKNQSLESEGQLSSAGETEKISIKKKIQEFLKKNDGNGKIDKNYVLFLFQIYGYKDGVKDCCKSLNLRQELLTFYIHHNATEEIFEWCRNPGVSRGINEQDQDKKDRAQQDADLWIQALTYFRDLQDQIKSEMYLKRSLEHIGENNILSPLLVLEILAPKKNLKFEVLSPFLIKKLKDQQRVIKSKQEGELNKKGEVEKNGVKQMTERIDAMREDIRLMKTQAKNFDQKNCDQCGKELALPSVHFICGHSFDEFCVDGDQIKRCNIHGQGFDEKIRRKEQYNLQAHDQLKFNQELWKKPQKFDTIANYFGQGLFSDLGAQLESIDKQATQ